MADEGDARTAAQLKELTQAGYVNGFLACLIRFMEEAAVERGRTIESVLPKLRAEAKALPGYSSTGSPKMK